MQLTAGNKVALVACSNGLPVDQQPEVQRLMQVLRGMGLCPVCSDYLYAGSTAFAGTAAQRAAALQQAYADSQIRAIFDISGGDMANQLLDLLDYRQIAASPKPFFGYSDLTVLLNALYTKTGAVSYLYQVKNLIWQSSAQQQPAFVASMFSGADDLFRVKWHFLRGERMSGTLLGGNLRCLLKLAGTPYMPDLTGKLLFIESLGGGVPQMITYLSQLRQLGVFKHISGLLLGTFTYMQQHRQQPSMHQLVLQETQGCTFPIAYTSQVGHANTSRCLPIGGSYTVQLP